jgi:hypothetical protein
MQSVGRLAAAIIGCFILTLVCVTPAAFHADDWNLATRFVVNQPFEVPGMVLQPNTRYVIKLFDSPSERRVVQIYNGDETKQLTMFMAIADERQEVADHTVFSFIETDPGYPVPIKEWFYPGRLNGLEFIYPKSQALEIAHHAREPIQATADVDLHDLASVTVVAIEPIREGFATTATSAENVTKSETTEVASVKPTVTEENTETNPPVAQNEESTAIAQNNTTTEKDVQSDKTTESSSINSEQSNQNALNQTAQNNTEENRELPRTAGELPLIALIGALCVGAGVGMKVLSAKS